ncbi:MAG: TonB family protein [Deltaproteobacteria bacterium]|jgi:TonB family protein|nr:TonB family protein [Deltaproteobacteria bacterium]
MALPRSSRWLLASGLGHSLVFALLLSLPGPPAVTSPARVLRVTEFALETPPPPPTPAPTTPPPVEPATPPPVEPTARGVAPRRAALPAPRSPAAPSPAAPPPAAPPPAAPPPAAAPPVLSASDLLRPRVDALSVPSRSAAETPSGSSRAGLFPGSTGTEEERARSASQGFVREALGATVVREAPGVRTYLWNVRRRVAEAWRPGVVRVPNLGDTLMAGFIAPETAIRIFGDRMIRRQRQVLEAAAQPRLGGAADAIEAIGGVSGNGLNANRPPMATSVGDESWRRNVRTTRAEVQVDQDEDGRVLDVRLLHPSGIPGFDRAAIEAVRHGLEEQDPMPLPGGRRSRWSFTVVATRRLFAPSVGGAFDESRGWFRIEVPGQVTLRSRVQMESSAPRPAATP